MKIYLANCLGFYKNTTIVNNFAQDLQDLLLKKHNISATFFNPFPNENTEPQLIAEKNNSELLDSDVLIAFLDFNGPDPDCGVSWEVGYACGYSKSSNKKICVLGITDSIRQTDVGNSVYNIQLMQNLDGVYSIQDLDKIASTINFYL